MNVLHLDSTKKTFIKQFIIQPRTIGPTQNISIYYNCKKSMVLNFESGYIQETTAAEIINKWKKEKKKN